MVTNRDDLWLGGSIDLLLLFRGPSAPSPGEVTEAVWAWSPLEGPYLDRAMESRPSRESPNVDHLYGRGRLPTGQYVPFETYIVVDSDGVWVYAGAPVGGLGEVYPIEAYPFEASATTPWVLEVHGWLESLAAHVGTTLNFERGVIGWLTLLDVGEPVQGTVPETRYQTYLVLHPISNGTGHE